MGWEKESRKRRDREKQREEDGEGGRKKEKKRKMEENVFWSRKAEFLKSLMSLVSLAGAQGWALCGRSHQKLSWRRLEGRGCRACLPGLELRLYLVLSRVTRGECGMT